MNNTPRRPDSFICLLSLRGGEGAIGEFEAFRIFSSKFSNFPQARNSGRPHHGGNWALAVTTAGTARQPVRPTRLGRSRRDGNSLLTLYFTPFELLGNRSGRHGDRSGIPRRRAETDQLLSQFVGRARSATERDQVAVPPGPRSGLKRRCLSSVRGTRQRQRRPGLRGGLRHEVTMRPSLT